MTVFVNFVRRHPDAVVPTKATEGACGFDLTAVSMESTVTAASKESTNLCLEYDTGIAVAIPRGYVGLIFPRSSVSKTGWQLSNSVGVIDQDYRGTIKLRFNDSTGVYLGPPYLAGDRIGQLVIVPNPQVIFSEKMDLDGTDRGDGGFGSTGD